MTRDPDPSSPVFLIVDDDPLIVHTLAKAIRPLGKVSFTTAFDQVHITAATLKPQVILLDVDLPRITGLDIARLIRSNPDLDGTRILLMTAHHAPSLLKEGETITGGPVLRKPIDLDQLVAMLKDWVDPSSAA